MTRSESVMTEPAARRPLRILVINWQDRLNPQAGGAELHLHEIFRRIRRRGHQVTLLVSGWAEAKRQEEIDGLHVYRTHIKKSQDQSRRKIQIMLTFGFKGGVNFNIFIYFLNQII